MKHAKEFEYVVQIKEHHLDSFGHVNNAVYLALFEEARWQFITENGYGIDAVHEYKQGPVVLDVKIRFKKEMKNREFIKIHSHSGTVKGKIMKLHQQMLNQDNEVCSEAEFTFGFMDLQARKLIVPTPQWLKAMGIEE
jgi:YbgC/YbaW family acyl-CoA thioester hydrolase